MSEDAAGSSLEARTQAFLAEFFDRGEQLVRDLILQNDALRQQIRGLEVDRSPSAELVDRLRDEVARLQAECDEIKRLAGSVKRESGDYRDRLDELESAHYHLAARQVSAEQLRHSESLDEAVRATIEILLNLVGTGHFTLYGVDVERDVFFPLAVEGRDADPSTPEVPCAADGPLAAAASAKVPWRAGSVTSPAALPMVLPLVCQGRTIAAVHLHRFLPQKQGFTDDDLALLELISEESAAAIDTAWVRAHARPTPFSRAAVEALLA